MILDLRPQFEERVKTLVNSPETRALLAEYGLSRDTVRHLKITESVTDSNKFAVLDKAHRVLTLNSAFLDEATDEQLHDVIHHELSHLARNDAGLEGQTEGGEGLDNDYEFEVVRDDVDFKRMQGYSEEAIREYLVKRFKGISSEEIEKLLASKDVQKGFDYDHPPHIESGSVKDLTYLSLPLGIVYKLISRNKSDERVLIKDAMCDFLDKMHSAALAIKDEVYTPDKGRLGRFRDAVRDSSELLKTQDFNKLEIEQLSNYADMIRECVVGFLKDIKYLDVKFGFMTEQLKRVELAFDRYNDENNIVAKASLKTAAKETIFTGDWDKDTGPTHAVALARNSFSLLYLDSILLKLGYSTDPIDKVGDDYGKYFKTNKSPNVVRFELQSAMKKWYKAQIHEIRLEQVNTPEEKKELSEVFKNMKEQLKNKSSLLSFFAEEKPVEWTGIGNFMCDPNGKLWSTAGLEHGVWCEKFVKKADGTPLDKNTDALDQAFKLGWVRGGEDAFTKNGETKMMLFLQASKLDNIKHDSLNDLAKSGKYATIYVELFRTFYKEFDAKDLIDSGKTLEDYVKSYGKKEAFAFLNIFADLPKSTLTQDSKTYNEMTLTPEERKQDDTEMFTRSQNPDYALSPANRNEYSMGSDGKAQKAIEWIREILGLGNKDTKQTDKDVADDVGGCYANPRTDAGVDSVHAEPNKHIGRLDPLLEAYPENTTGENTFQNPEQAYPETPQSSRPVGGFAEFLNMLKTEENKEDEK